MPKQTRESAASVLRGRNDAFCAGLDLATLARGGDEAQRLLVEMGDILVDLYSAKLRVVSVCSGHAVAAGAMLLLVSDHRLAAPGSYKIGFSEVAQGMPLPALPIALAQARLDPRRIEEVTNQGRLMEPDLACETGFVDAVIEPSALDTTADARATELAALDDDAYARTAATVRKETLAIMRASVEAQRGQLAD